VELAAARAAAAAETSRRTVLDALADMSPPNAWAAAARARQEGLAQQVGALSAAIALLEARAEVREGQLAAAEAAAATAASGTEALLRARYEALVATKDGALRGARAQVAALTDALAKAGGGGTAGGSPGQGGGRSLAFSLAATQPAMADSVRGTSPDSAGPLTAVVA
jgi:hypothetical protein